MAAISGCSFVIEPGDLWQRRILRRYLKAAPFIEGGEGGERFVCPALPELSVRLADVPWLNQPLSSDDLQQRLEQATDLGVGAEILFPTLAWSLFSSIDAEFEAACMVAYNIWFSSVASSSPLRFFGAAMIPAGAAGLAELERCAKLTFRAAIIAANSADALPEEQLAAAAGVGLPVVLTQRGSATPATDFQQFGHESAVLARAALRLAGKQPKLIVLGDEAAALSRADSINRVSSQPPEGEDAGALWGHLGRRSIEDLRSCVSDQAFFRDNAVGLYQLPDVTDARFNDMRKARQLASRVS
jgi:hypothetical protein